MKINKILKKSIFFILLILLNISCSNLRSKDTGPKETVNSYYSQNSLPEISYRKSLNPEYFVFKNDTNKKSLSGTTNREYLSFYKNKEISGYGDGSPYWRWEIHYTKEQMNAIINNNLHIVAKETPKNVYTLKNGVWTQGIVGQNPVGEVKQVRAIKRGSSGVVMDLYIEGSKGRFVVTKENRVRRVLSHSKESLKGLPAPYFINKNGKSFHNASTLMPSGFFAVEKTSRGFSIYGGGFGHGIGLPQYAARDLARNGFDYEDILKRYYHNSSIKSMNSIFSRAGDLRVGITTNQGGVSHTSIKLSSEKGIKLVAGKSKYNLPKNKIVVIKRNKNEVVASVGNKIVLRTKGNIKVKSSGMIKVNSLTRSVKTKNPMYRGSFEIIPYEGKMLLVNIVDMEDYLKQVVVSEMPASFGLEALKAQAVVARTYSYEKMLNSNYKNFHVVDTIVNQVYNNKDEIEIVNEAIKKTKGEILKYKDAVVPAYYYSTSGGYSATPREIW